MKNSVTIIKQFINDLESETRMSKEIKNIEVSSKFFDKLVENLTISHTLHQADYNKNSVTIYTGVARVTITRRD